MTDAAAQPAGSWDEVCAKVSVILRGLTRATLDSSDGRRLNQDALDLRSEVITRIVARLNDPRLPQITNVLGLAAKITYNVYHDHLRRKNPAFSSLQNQLFYFFEHDKDYGTWRDEADCVLGGRAKWRNRPESEDCSKRLEKICEDPRLIFPKSLPKMTPNMKKAQWRAVVAPILDHLEFPVPVNELVKTVAKLYGKNLSLNDEATLAPDVVSGERRQDDYVITKEALQRLWVAVVKLELRKRRAFLLNPPQRSELAVFEANDIATVREIGSAIALNEEQYSLVWSRLPLSEDQRERLCGLSSDALRFAALWKVLPLNDSLIAALLGATQQQVINLRMVALRAVAKQLQGYV